ncbi:MAG: glycosyltransferase family A protein, partial [Actinomycetota bacterium]
MTAETVGSDVPRVSVCVPAYRAERFLAATIESVLDQTYADWELIVLDNASPDRTGEIARSYDDPRIRVLSNRDTLPLADNWNAVAAQATAPYLKLLCADDLIGPDCLASEVAVLDREPDVVMVAS